MEHLTRNQMFDLIDGVCNVAEKECFEEHVGSCETCSREIELMQDIGMEINRLPQVKTSLRFTESLMNKILLPEKKEFSFKTILYKGYYLIVVLLAMIFFYALYKADWNTLRWEFETKNILNNFTGVYDNTYKEAVQFFSNSFSKILPSSIGTAGSTFLFVFIAFAVFYFIDKLVGKKIIRFLS